MRERYLLRADRAGYGYKDILDVSPASLRILVPDSARRQRWWIFIGILVVSDVFGLGSLLSLYGAQVLDLLVASLGSFWGNVLYSTLPWLGAVVIVGLGDGFVLRYLARHPVQIIPVDFLGSESFWFFQELRVRAGGQVMRLTVNGTRRTVAKALRLTRFPPRSAPS